MPELISDYKDLAFDLARITCHVNCMHALKEDKKLTKRERLEHQKTFKKARKEQDEVLIQIFNNEV